MTRKSSTDKSLPSPSQARSHESFVLKLQQLLLCWFAEQKRELPWRVTRDPYHIWVSEVMLQQTQVVKVVPYFERFLERFPTIHHLAAAEESAVLLSWEGLGYYRRARHLHQAAQVLVKDGGFLPADPDYWLALPGVGRYIMGAVLSQAFDLRLPIVEANSKRVLARFFGYKKSIQTSTGQSWLWEAAESLLPSRQVGDFNQALMELGALVCTPLSPRCDDCPWRSDCAARREGNQELLPVQAHEQVITKTQESAIMLLQGDRILLGKRPPHVRWGNLWEFPHLALRARETHLRAAHRLLKEYGIVAQLRSPFPTIHFAVIRYRIALVAFLADYQSGNPRTPIHDELCWFQLEQVAQLPMSNPQRRLISFLHTPPE